MSKFTMMVAGGLVGGGIIAGLTAGTAHADTYGTLGDHNGAAFAQELYPGMYGSAGDARALAVTVCGARSAGITEDALIRNLQRKYSTNLSVDIVIGAEFHFCPHYATVA